MTNGNANLAVASHMPLSLRRNFSWTLCGNIIYYGCQWATMVVLAKIGTVEQVGRYALALAIVVPVISLSNLQLRTLQSTDARREFQFGHYLTVRLTTSALALLAIIAISFLQHQSMRTTLVILAVALAKTLDSLSDVFYGLLQQHERMDRIAISLINKGLMQLGILWLLVYLTQKVFIGVLGMAAISGLILLTYDVQSAKLVLLSAIKQAHSLAHLSILKSTLRPLWNRAALLNIVGLGLPIGIVTALNSLATNIPRYFIAYKLGERELGIFAAMVYLTIAGSMLIGAMVEPGSPRLAKYFSERDYAKFSHLLLILIGIAVAIGVAGLSLALVAGRQVLTILYRPEYAEHTGTFVWLMAGSIPLYVASILGVSLNSMRRFYAQVPLPFINLLFILALSAYLIPRYGLEGAGRVIFIGSTLSMLSTASLLIFCLRKSQWSQQTLQSKTGEVADEVVMAPKGDCDAAT